MAKFDYYWENRREKQTKQKQNKSEKENTRYRLMVGCCSGKQSTSSSMQSVLQNRIARAVGQGDSTDGQPEDFILFIEDFQQMGCQTRKIWLAFVTKYAK